ncbi:MAG: hypothetical protein J6F31_09495 [Oscillospiraceae bacterium]|nr:hypothetical protein [Oscillospiraceae bacterium]
MSRPLSWAAALAALLLCSCGSTEDMPLPPGVTSPESESAAEEKPSADDEYLPAYCRFFDDATLRVYRQMRLSFGAEARISSPMEGMNTDKLFAVAEYDPLMSNVGSIKAADSGMTAVAEYILPHEEYIKDLSAAYSVCDKLIAQTADMTDFEKLCFFHDTIMKEAHVSEYGQKVHFAYGCLEEGNANRGGYARAFALLCLRSGIDCVCVEGAAYGTGEERVWNKVLLDGTWYNADVAEDDLEGLSHRYFLISDEKLSAVYFQSDTGLSLPADDDSLDYYKLTDAYASKRIEYENAFRHLGEKAVERGEDSFEIKFSSPEVVENYVNNKELMRELMWDVNFNSGELTITHDYTNYEFDENEKEPVVRFHK